MTLQKQTSEDTAEKNGTWQEKMWDFLVKNTELFTGKYGSFRKNVPYYFHKERTKKAQGTGPVLKSMVRCHSTSSTGMKGRLEYVATTALT